MALQARKQDIGPDKILAFLQELFQDYGPRDFAVENWDGTSWQPQPGQFRRFTWKINRPGALHAALAEGSQLALAEAYIYGDFDIDGDMEAAFRLADYLASRKWSLQEKLRLGALLFDLPSFHRTQRVQLHGRAHSKERDRQAMGYHYDVSNDFYALWLGREMVYSCAYFLHPDDTLDAAQEQKLDYICRKLRLQPGEKLLDIGCGWGGLILHAVREYGVRALGITLSQQQFLLATDRIRKAGLSDRCEVKLLDYRDVQGLDDKATGSYDKLVSVGMVEHVGADNLSEYFRQAFQLLRPGGVFLCHGIGIPESRAALHQSVARGTNFVDLYVFPDGELVPIAAMAHAAEQAGFEVRDVENLREHYTRTLRHWVYNMEQYAGAARQLVDEVTYRIWHLHMAGSAYYFDTGKLELYQTLLVKNDNGRSGLPLTRADWHADSAS